jgi:hypothetical protein
MHVSDIVVGRVQSAVSRPKWTGTAQVTIVTAQGDPLANATVAGVFNTHPQPRTATTGPDGVANLTSKETNRPPADWCLEVTNVTHATYTYTPADNVVTYACESGPVYKSGPSVALPGELNLFNRPNPFNPATDICFTLPEASHVKLEVFNIAGQVVTTLTDRYLDAGEHVYTWDGSNVASGVYLYRITTDDVVETRKMVLMK